MGIITTSSCITAFCMGIITTSSCIKGSAESEFRTGDVTISPQDLGLDADTYAKKSIYGDTSVSLGRKSKTAIGIRSFAFGENVEAVDAAFTIPSSDTENAFALIVSLPLPMENNIFLSTL